MKNLSTQSNQINIAQFKEMLKNSVELAFESLSDDIGDHLFNFEKLQVNLQLVSDNYPEEVIDKLAASLDELFLSQMDILINKIHEEVHQYINLQEISYSQKIS